MQRSFHEKTEDLQAKHQSEIQKLTQDLENQKKNYAKEEKFKRSQLEKEIQEKLNELEIAKKDLDDRSNTFVRRAIRSEIKDSIKESLSQSLFSTNTAAQRKPIKWAYTIFIALAAIFTAYSTYQLNSIASISNAAEGPLLIAKASIGGFTTIGLGLLYLKWETSWINQQSEFERILSATRVDIDRASWVVESILEWNRESDSPMPQDLTNALTRRLFDWDAKVEENQTTVDSLASAILGSAANVKIGKDGAELNLDSKSLKKLSRSEA